MSRGYVLVNPLEVPLSLCLGLKVRRRLGQPWLFVYTLMLMLVQGVIRSGQGHASTDDRCQQTAVQPFSWSFHGDVVVELVDAPGYVRYGMMRPACEPLHNSI